MLTMTTTRVIGGDDDDYEKGDRRVIRCDDDDYDNGDSM